MTIRLVGIVLILAGINACSPYSYRAEVAAFSDGVEHSILGMSAMLERAADTRIAKDRADMANLAPEVDYAGLCGGAAIGLAVNRSLDSISEALGDEAQACRLLATNLSAENFREKGVAQSRFEAALQGPARDEVARSILPEGNVYELLNALETYGDALADLAGTEDRSELTSAWFEGQSAIEKLACNIEDQEICSSTASQFSEVVGTILVSSLDHMRFRRLEDIVTKSDPAIQAATTVLRQLQTQIIGLQAAEQSIRLEQALADLRPGMDTESWLAAYDNLLSQRDIYLSILQDGSVDGFGKMALAHSALAQAIKDPKRDLRILAEKLSDFASDAKQLAAIYL